MKTDTDDTSHVYRVTVQYQNPKADSIPEGGMGVVGGVFLPSESWPATNTSDFVYSIDRKHYLRELRGDSAALMAQINGTATPKKEAEHHHH